MDLTPGRFEQWIAVLLGRALANGVPVEEFWRRDGLYDYSSVSNIMPRDEWKAISGCLCIYNPMLDPAFPPPPEFIPGPPPWLSPDCVNRPDLQNVPSPAYTREADVLRQPYWKATDFCDLFAFICRRNYNPGRFLSRDEQCIRNNHRTGLRHYRMPKKYVTNGIRSECLTTPDGVICDFVIDVPNVPYELKTIHLLRNLKTKGHIIFCDRLYTSVKVLEKALAEGQYVCGTAKSNSGFPHCLAAGNLELTVGQWENKCRGSIAAYAWMDSSHCQLLTTYHTPTAGIVMRRVRGQAERLARPAPSCFVDYNLGMGGNDCGDMLRSRISCHLTTVKWWKAVFFYCIDQAAIATFRIWSKALRNKVVKGESLSLRGVLENLILAIGHRADQITRKRRFFDPQAGAITPRKKFKAGDEPDPGRFTGMHLVEPSMSKDTECVRCRKQGLRRRTSLRCQNCTYPLCATCFVPFHTK